MRMNRVALPLLLILLAGCTHTVRTVAVQDEENYPGFSEDAAVCVARSPGGVAFEWDDQLSAKIELLLRQKGYTISDSGSADYFLFFDYRALGLEQWGRLELLHGKGMETVKRGGPYVHSLSLRLVDAVVYRDDEEMEVAWQGGAVMDSVPTESTKFHDLVLIAAFDQFGMDSHDAVVTKIALNDSRAKKLRKRPE